VKSKLRPFSIFACAAAALLCAAASPAWAQTGNGLVGEYYNNNTFTNPIADTRFNETGLPPGATFNFAYGAGGPGGAIAATNNFSIRWRGQIEFPAAETVPMTTVVNNVATADNARLVINGVQITNGTGTQTANFVVPAPGKYDIMIEYSEGTSDGSFVLRWNPPSLGGVIADVPNNRLYSPTAIPNISSTPSVNTMFAGSQNVDLATTTPGAVIKYVTTLSGDPGFSPGPTGTVFASTLNFTTHTRIAARAYLEGVSSALISFFVSPNFNPVTDPGNRVAGLFCQEYTGNGTLTTPFPAATAIPRQNGTVVRVTHLMPPLPFSTLDNNNIAVLYKGYITVPETGFWTFFSSSDDGSRVFVDGVQVVDNNFNQGTTERSGDIFLTAGLHQYEAQWSNGTGGLAMEARWQAIGGVTPKQIIPDAAFTCDPLVATPTMTPNGGGFSTTQNVQLDCTTPGAVLYYTLDGTFPDVKLATGSCLPGTTITLDATTRLRVVGVRPGLNPSVAASAIFTKSPQIVSVVSSATSTGANPEVIVMFDKPVGQTAAETVANYSLSGGLTIDSATLMNRPNAGAVLSDGLMGHWKLDDLVTSDSSDNNNPGTVTAVSLDTGNKVPSVVGNVGSLTFNGTTSYVSIPNSALQNPGHSSFTVSVWIHPTSVAATRRIVNKYFDATTAGWLIDLNPGGVIRLLLRDVGSANSLDYTTGYGMVPAGQWSHIAARIDKLANRATLFLNGQTYGVIPLLGTGFGSVTNTAPIGIGTIPTGTSDLDNFFLGNIDEFRYYLGALSDSEIYALSQGTPHVNSTVRLAINAGTPLVASTTYTLNVNNLTDSLTPATTSGALSKAFLHRATGTLTYERFASTGTSTVADLARTAAFPNTPNGFLAPTLSEVATNQAETYGARMRGYFIPGTTGDWKFAISTQDQGKLFMSTDADPANKRLISLNNTSTPAVRDFSVGTQSVQIPLVADQKYYFEAYIKDNTGTDYISIVGKVGDPTAFGVGDTNQLTGAQISPWVDPVVILTQPVSRIATLGSTVSFSITAQATLLGFGQPRYQWKFNGANIVGANAATYTTPALTALQAGDYTCEVSDGIGNTVLSAIANLTVMDFSAPPTISSLDVTNGPSSGGQDITITGTNFINNKTTVVFGTSQSGFSPVANLVVVNSTTLTLQTTAHAAGLVNVQVTTNNPTAFVSIGAYTYHDVPTIAGGGLSPVATNEAATVVTITGTNFVAGQTTVSFGTAGAGTGVNVTNSTTLTVTSPVSPTLGTIANVNVSVTTPGGTSGTSPFTYYPPPDVTSITPDSGNRAAQAVTIGGTNFAPGLTTVTFLTVGPAGSVVATNTTITCTAPAFAGLGTDPITVQVTTPGGTDTIIYTYYGPPSISTITPSAGPRGTQAVVIAGTNFAPGQTNVSVLGVGGATGITATNNQINCTLPANPGVGITPVTVQVTTPGGGPATITYTYFAVPTISLVNPDTGPHAGSLVTITGTNFSTVAGQTTVTFGAIGTVPATATNSTTLTCNAPASGTTGTLVVNVTVNAPGGSSGTLPYTYRDAPTFTSINFITGPSQGGQAVTITGNNFVAGQTSVTFGGTAATGVNVTSPTTLDCITPGHDAGAVQIAITSPAGTGTSSPTAYTYVGPRILTVTPVSGPVGGGQSVTITGSGFTGTTAVDFGGSAATVTNETPTTLTVQTTAHLAGLVAVSVTAGGNTATLAGAYTYVSTATVTNVSPSRGPVSGGQLVTVTGSGFSPGQTSVTIGGTVILAGSVNVTAATTLQFTTPTHAAGLVDVSVTTFSNPPVTLANSYTYVDPPTIASVVPNRGPIGGGQLVTITGTNFELGAGDTTVTVDALPPVLAAVSSANTLTFTTPAHAAGATTVRVNTFALQSSTTSPYTYVDPNASVDLALTITPDTLTPGLGGNVTFNLALNNTGVQNATGVEVTAPLPGGLTQVTATPSVGTYVGGIWTVGNLNSGAGASLAIVATVNSSTAQTFTAEVTACAQTDVDSTISNGILGEDDMDQEIVSSALTIQTAAGALPSSTTGAFYYQRITATGGVPPYRWSLAAGSTPLPFDLDPLTGVISGTGPVATGTFPFTLQVSDANSSPATDTRAFSILVNAAVAATPPTVTATPLPPGGTVGVAYSHTFTATGGPAPYTWSVPVGTLPAGLVLNTTTGRVAGTPTAAATSNFTIRASNATAPPSDQPFSITIVANPVTIVTTSIANGSVGSLYDQTIQAVGGLGPTFNWSLASGTIPSGLTLTGTTRIATIAGTPATNGAFNFTLQATDAAGGAIDTQVFTGQILVGSAPFAPTSVTNPPTGTVGDNFFLSLTGVGGARPYGWTLTAGSLPTGVTFNGPAGTISGTPSVAGVFQIQVLATDNVGATGSQTILINIAPAPSIPTASPLPSAVSGIGYSTALSAVGGAPPLTWSVTGGALPTGLQLHANSGVISGTSAVLGTATATIRVTDANGIFSSKAFDLTVANPASATISILDSLPPAEAGVPYSATVQVAGGTPPYTYALAPGSSVPTWAIFDTATGTIYGTPDTSVLTFQIQVTDAGSGNATSSALGVTTPLSIVQTSLPAGSIGGAYATSLTVTGGAGSPLWTLVSGSLPPGLAFDSGGLLSGVPQTAGVSTFTLRASDTAGAIAQRQFSVTVGAAGPPPGGGGGGGGGGCGLTGAELLLLWFLRRRARR
jgi:hypothetical protein